MRKLGARLVVAVALMLGGGAAVFGVINAGAVGPPTTFVVDDANDASLGSGSPTACQSTDFEVDSEEVGTCTLRAAIEASENLGTDTIIDLPPPGTVANNPSTAYAVLSSLGQLDVSDDASTVTIAPVDGATQGNTIIAAACDVEECTVNNRVLKVETGTTADISGVTIEDGNPGGGTGGGILNCGTLNLSDATVTDNTASDDGGGIDQSSGGSTTLDNVTVSHNTSDEGGGLDVEGSGSASTMTVTDSTVTNNTATDDDGGGIEIGGSDNIDTVVDIEGSTISNNTTSDDDGGGISQDAVSALTVNNSTISGNNANGDDDFGGGAVLEAGEENGATASITNDTITGNFAYGGGGIASFEGANTINNSTISDNTASEGGGGVLNWTEGDGSTTITNSTISGNTVVGDVGESLVLGEGGGILSFTEDESDCSPLTMVDDTIANNQSVDGGGYASNGCGTTEEEAGVRTSHAVHLTTQPAHQAAHARHQVTSGPDALFLFDTFASNSASDSDSGGNIDIEDSSDNTLANSIVAYGIIDTVPTTNCAFGDGSSLTSLGYNLIDDSTCGTAGTGDIIGKDPLLGSLTSNGGPTNTELPGSGSPAIGGVPASVCTASAVTADQNTDQRGLPRPGNPIGTCTIGAVEVQVVVPPPPPAFNPNGYRMAAYDGGVFDFGIQYHGSLANVHLNAPIIGIANNPGPDGYLLVASDGGVFALGGANYFGSLGGQPLTSPIAAIAATPDGGGYWLASQAGTIYNYGDAPKLPAVVVPNGDRIVGIASTNDGKGLWLTDNSGDVYTQGDAQYLGSLGGQHLNAAIVGIAAAATGQGYILAAADGGVFAFGVGFFGSVPGVLKPGQVLNEPIVGIAETHSGNGYWEVGADGGVFCFGDAPFLGSLYTQLAPGQKLNGPIIGIQHLGAAPAA